jgi:hypothetical protein
MTRAHHNGLEQFSIIKERETIGVVSIDSIVHVLHDGHMTRKSIIDDVI